MRTVRGYLTAALGALCWLATAAHAQTEPAKPVVPLVASAIERLRTASTPEAATTLLNANPSWVTPAVFDGLLEVAGRDVGQDFALGRQGFLAAESVAQLLGDDRGIALSLNGLGFAQFRQGHLPDALETFRRGASAAERAHDGGMLAELLRGVGLCQRLTGDVQGAVTPTERSLQLAREAGNMRLVASVLSDLGLLHQDLGDLRRRDTLLQEALRVAEEHHLDVQARNVYNNLGAAYVSQGDLEAGLGYLQKSLAIDARLNAGPAFAANMLVNIGTAQLRLGQFSEAQANYERALEQFTRAGDERSMAIVHTNLGELLRVQGRFAEAEGHLTQAVRLHDTNEVTEGRVEARVHLAWSLLGRGQSEAALETGLIAVALAEESHTPALLIKALTPLGEIRRQRGEVREARRVLERAVELVESTRRNLGGGGQGQGFLEDYIAPYHALIALEVGEGRTREALAVAERTKGRQLFDLVHPGPVEITRAMTPEERAEERLLAGEVSHLQVALTAAEGNAAVASAGQALTEGVQRIEAFRATLYRAHPELRLQRGDLPLLTNADLARLVPDAPTAVVEYVVTERDTFGFVITRRAGGAPTVSSFRIAMGRADLQREVEGFQRQLGSRDLGVRRTAQRLYRVLLGPCATRLQGKSLLAIVPDGPLWSLPVQALMAPSGRYVVDDAAVFSAPSLTALASTMRAKRQAGPRRLFALAAPTPETAAVPSAALPRTAVDARELARLYGASSSRVLAGAEAREDVWKREAGAYRVLHFATHGVLNSANPLYSYLVMAAAPDSSDDGLLEAREVLDLELHADLAVLSACETAGGRFRYGEGQIGMSWAFLVAGVPTIVVSQWKVDEASTGRLMLAFHRELLASGDARLTGRARALQRAARTMAHSAVGHPFYWAAFTMIGNGY